MVSMSNGNAKPSADVLVIPPTQSFLPNQSIVAPPPPSHLLSAADDLVSRFQLHDSYYVLLHPFRKDVHLNKNNQGSHDVVERQKTAKVAAAPCNAAQCQGPISSTAGTPPAAATPASPSPPAINATTPRKSGNNLAILPRTYAHFLPPSLPGKVNPQKPPRKHQVLARKAAQQNILKLEDPTNETGPGSSAAQVTNKERALAKAQEEWERISTTLRRTVMKPEYTPAAIRPLDEETLRGYAVEAGEVDIDRSQLEADALSSSTPPRKKKKNHRPVPSASGQSGGVSYHSAENLTVKS